MKDISIYRSTLEEEKVRLEQELSTIARPNPQNPGDWEAVETEVGQEADPNDQAGLLDEYQENRAIVEVLNARYHEVTAALGRIEDGTYGVCIVSGEEIEEDRLEADAAAPTSKAHMESHS